MSESAGSHKRPAENGEEMGIAPKRRKKLSDKRLTQLMRIYSMLKKEIRKLEEREIDLFGDYDEEKETDLTIREAKLRKKMRELLNFLLKHQIFVDENMEAVKFRELPVFKVTTTGNEHLNELLTKLVKQKETEKRRGFNPLTNYRFLTVDDVIHAIEEIRDSHKPNELPEGREELESMAERIIYAVNKELKLLCEGLHSECLESDWLVGNPDFPSTSSLPNDLNKASPVPGEDEKMPSWDNACMKLADAALDGELAQDVEGDGEGRDEEFETDMPLTKEEIEDEEDDEEEESDDDLLKETNEPEIKTPRASVMGDKRLISPPDGQKTCSEGEDDSDCCILDDDGDEGGGDGNTQNDRNSPPVIIELSDDDGNSREDYIVLRNSH